ncbi:MAG: glutamyl-tRNA reductase [Dehalococcoidia bacterium]|nr:glutamyl-tRNA reductase [Dehalococcoidia bacterium]MSQ17120.1 glutamyl-tRNA reductase [Dehalococcoidia bacterium]
MSFLVLGLNHRTAPLELREQLSVEKEQLAPALERLRQHVDQGVVLSTCNRLEVYVLQPSQSPDSASPGAEAHQQVRQFLSEMSGLSGGRQRSLPELAPHLYQYQEEDCVRHLFRVASGLDSMVVGERQVLGQVRAAFSAASQDGNLHGPLSRLFHQALRVGRRVHRDIPSFRDNSRSVSQAAVELARRLLGDLAQRRALVIGAGDAGRLVAQALSDAGVRQIVVTNRTQWRAEDLARELGGVAAPWDDRDAQLAAADVVISSTGAPGYVLDRDAVERALQHGNGRPLLLIDIAVPRDIDPAVAGLSQVQLYDIDALQTVAEVSQPGGRLAPGVAQAEAIVSQETATFLAWWRALDSVPVIAALRARAEELRRAEVARTLRHIKNDWQREWPPEAGPLAAEQLAQRLDAMTQALVNKLLHQPTVRLKDLDAPAQQALARQLFDLDKADGPGDQ